MADPSTNLKVLIRAIKSRSPVSFHYDKAGKTPGLRIGNPHAAFILHRKDGTESTKIDIVQTAAMLGATSFITPQAKIFKTSRPIPHS
jgi:hypothetical protein